MVSGVSGEVAPSGGGWVPGRLTAGPSTAGPSIPGRRCQGRWRRAAPGPRADAPGRGASGFAPCPVSSRGPRRSRPAPAAPRPTGAGARRRTPRGRPARRTPRRGPRWHRPPAGRGPPQMRAGDARWRAWRPAGCAGSRSGSRARSRCRPWRTARAAPRRGRPRGDAMRSRRPPPPRPRRPPRSPADAARRPAPPGSAVRRGRSTTRPRTVGCPYPYVPAVDLRVTGPFGVRCGVLHQRIRPPTRQSVTTTSAGRRMGPPEPEGQDWTHRGDERPVRTKPPQWPGCEGRSGVRAHGTVAFRSVLGGIRAVLCARVPGPGCAARVNSGFVCVGPEPGSRYPARAAETTSRASLWIRARCSAPRKDSA